MHAHTCPCCRRVHLASSSDGPVCHMRRKQAAQPARRRCTGPSARKLQTPSAQVLPKQQSPSAPQVSPVRPHAATQAPSVPHAMSVQHSASAVHDCASSLQSAHTSITVANGENNLLNKCLYSLSCRALPRTYAANMHDEQSGLQFQVESARVRAPSTSTCIAATGASMRTLLANATCVAR